MAGHGENGRWVVPREELPLQEQLIQQRLAEASSPDHNPARAAHVSGELAVGSAVEGQ